MSRLSFLVLVWMVSGCASVPQETAMLEAPTPSQTGQIESNQEAVAQNDTKLYWWYVRFRLNWPEDQAPDWALDTLLADLVCASALADFGQSVELWRFHRRAARDQAGRQFSFIFYTDTVTAQAINRYINSDSLTQELLLRGYLKQVVFEQSSRRPDLEDTSDKSWAEVVQKSWPFFIMGVSEAWLDLIERIAIEEKLSAEQDLPVLLEGYSKVNATVDQIWRLHGKHAFLHHLNAIFGYQPLLMNY